MSVACDVVSDKLDMNQREMTSSMTARDQWSAEKIDLMTQLAEVSTYNKLLICLIHIHMHSIHTQYTCCSSQFAMCI